ncbi:hypothetical protein C8R44DRAFT_744379 [Mycena epipterygia]|nr:hypothetical protein C8R44DRAFT_744379 [Mycena epipterygia]
MHGRAWSLSNAAFLHGARGPTLLGQFACHWGHKTWVDWQLVTERKANLPGVHGILPVHVSVVGQDEDARCLVVVVSTSMPQFPALPMRALSSRTEVLGVWTRGSSQLETCPVHHVLHIVSGPASVRLPVKAVAGGANEGRSNVRKNKKQDPGST